MDSNIVPQTEAGSFTLTRSAPVLIIPDAFSPEECRFVIENMAPSAGDEMKTLWGVSKPQYGLLKFVKHQPHIDYISDRLRERVSLKIRDFYYLTRHCEFESIKVLEYKAGHSLGPHVDWPSTGADKEHLADFQNVTALQNRSVAISINLNDDYEGGEFRFPENSPHLYRAPAGAAIVFPCRMLHEVMTLRAGRRLAITLFLAQRRTQHHDWTFVPPGALYGGWGG